MLQEYIQKLLITAPPILFSLSVHECAHAWAADKMGDPTAKMLGRLTLNPLKHLDPIGTLMLFFSGLFGWAKPVPINPRNFRNLKRGDIIVSVAGPASNLVLAVFFAVILRLLQMTVPSVGLSMPGVYRPLMIMAEVGVIINIGMAVFNMLPIPPLDGSHVLSSLLPARSSYSFSKIQPYGFLILLIFIATGKFESLFAPVIYLLAGILLGGQL